MDRHIPIIISEGTPFERGLYLGQSEARRVAHSVKAYMAIFRLFGLRREAVFAQAERFIPTIEDFAPHLLEEMRGIAEGAGRDLREIVAINARTELMYGVTQPSECTAVGIAAEASADGHIRLAQNWDWIPTLAGAAILWVIRRNDGPDVLNLTEAGMMGKIGVNAAGLAMCVNLLKSDSDHQGPAVPAHVILRWVLEEATTVEEAITLLARTKRCTSYNHLLADRHGALASVEATPAGQRVIYPTNGVLTHTNHCLNAELFAYDRGARELPETLARRERAQSLAHEKVQERGFDEESLRTLLSDHGTSPHSICLHTAHDLPLEEQGESIASIIFDLTAGSVDIADGPPCQYAYRRLMVADYFKSMPTVQ